MVRPTKERGVVPFRANAIFGWDPGEVGAVVDIEPPVDRVVDAVAEMPVEVATAKVQEAEDSETSPASISVTLPAPPTEGNLLVALYWARGVSITVAAPSGWSMLGPADSPSFDGGTTALLYKFAGPGESDTVTVAVAAISHMWVGEFSGAGSLIASDLADAVAASTNLTTDVLTTPETHIVLIASFVQAARAASYTWGSGFSELDDHQLDASGPAGTAGWKDVTASDGTEVATATSTESDGYGWIMAAFLGEDRVWQQAPETQDEDDGTYRAFDVPAGPFWRTMLTEAYAAGTVRALIGFDTASSRTVTLEGSEDGTFGDAVTLASTTITATGSYTGDELAFTVATPGAYQFYRLVGAGAYDGRVYTVELFDYAPDDATAVAAELDAHVADPTDAHDASAVSYDNGASGLAADDVQDAIDELEGLIGSGGVLNNFAATTNPGVGDDSGDGYAIGSRWINTTTDEEFVATDVTGGAAVWKSTTSAGSGTFSPLVGSGRFGLTGIITSTVNADQNPFAPGSSGSNGVIRFTSLSANRTFRGFTAGTEGDVYFWVNNTNFSILLTNEDGTNGTAASRFRCPNGATHTIRQQGGVTLVYVGARWSVIAA